MTYATSDYGFYLEPKHFPEFLSKIKAKFGTDFKDIYDATAFLDEEYISSIILCDNVLFQSPKLEIKTLKKALVFHASGPTPPFGKQPYESQLPCPLSETKGMVVDENHVQMENYQTYSLPKT